MATPGFAPRGKKDRRFDTCLECDYWQADHITSPSAEGGAAVVWTTSARSHAVPPKKKRTRAPARCRAQVSSLLEELGGGRREVVAAWVT